jgi:hypothetical protein
MTRGKTARVKQLGKMHSIEDGRLQGFVYANGDLVDTLSWEDLEDIQWFSEHRRDRHP